MYSSALIYNTLLYDMPSIVSVFKKNFSYLFNSAIYFFICLKIFLKKKTQLI